MRADLPSGTVTFLFTDIAGSTRLLHELGDRYADALADHRRLLREAFGRHGGVEVDTQGDAFFVAFPRASGAVAAAAEAQNALAGGPLRVRMGIHTGEPTLTDEGYVGIDVHKGARIAAAGHGGQVLVSEQTARLLGSDGLVDLGLHRLKDLSAPERIFQLGGGEFPRLDTLYQTNLPIPTTPFVGRTRELEQLAGLIARDDVRLLTLTGAGGSGKTRLALQAAAAAADRYPHGVWWVPLAPVSDPAAVLDAAARAVGAAGSLADAVGDKRLLLLFDNFEHLIDAARDLSLVLTCCPGLDLLVTSRERLLIAAEQVYPVPVLARDDARRLFTARARAVRPAFEPDAELDDLCARLDDLPLALELAAARTGTLSTGELLTRLSGRLDAFRGGRDAEPRQQTLRSTIEWSHDLLSPDERRVFARMAVFSGGCTLDAAAAVCDADLELLESLVDKSLLRREGGRFWMLETIREFALERLADSAAREDVRRRHAEFFLVQVELAELDGELRSRESVEPSLEALRPELDNVRGALGWSLAHDPVLGLRIAAALEAFWILNPVEGVRWLGSLLERASHAPTELRATALRAYGGAANPAGQDDVAERAYAESLAQFRALGDEPAASTLLLRLGYAALYRRDLRRARALAEESLEAFTAGRNRRGESQSLGLLGEVEYAEGAREAGLELMERSAALAEETGFAWWRAGMLGKLVDCALDAGRLDQAATYGSEALALSRDLGDRLRIVRGLARLAVIAGARGDSSGAGRLWGAVEADEGRGLVGAWENERARFERSLLAYRGPDFERGREDGLRLTLDEAVEQALRP